MKRYVSSLFLLFCSGYSFGQDADSLLKEYSTYPDDTSKISLLFNKGFDLRDGDLNSAIKFSEACCKTALKVKDHHYLSQAYNLRATLKAKTGSYKEAAVDFERALLLRIQTKDTVSQIPLLNNLGNVYTELNDIYKADACFRNGLKLAMEAGDDHWVKGNLLGLAALQMKLEMYVQAEGNFTTLIQMCDSGEQEIVSICELNLGLCKLYAGDTIAAEAYELQALDELQMMGDVLGECDAYANLAEIYLAGKDLKECFSYLQQALAIAQKNNYAEGLMKTWSIFSEYYKLTGNVKESGLYLTRYDSALTANTGPRKNNSSMWSDETIEEANAEYPSHNFFRRAVMISLLILILAIVIIPKRHEQKE